ncbi:GAP family protein [Actinomycetospora sp. TBRC 11914]|uniref:GAP family protein n=1 Tax=Actinomycetospora sp. TBRC 11914 TaxID=2729387 RepID=UPI00145F2A72|nr:GAP family protein [Actinomycetospora sp. TBRC 11914]NMO93724.1 hypothetical protein [Actinomycetospora sp. TBRC 11914]
MSTEALLLGLVSAVRATPLAVIYALLLARRPARLLLAYVVSGLVVSLAVGIAIVAGLHVSAPSRTAGTVREVIDLGLGLAALAYAAASVAGWAPPWLGTREPRRGSWTAKLRNPSVPLAATAGAVTNLPGVFYLAGLVAILQTGPSFANGVLQVVVYNLLRFLVPVAVLLAVALDPDRTRRQVDAVRAWGSRHSRHLTIVLATVLGLYLTGKGLSGLLGASGS